MSWISTGTADAKPRSHSRAANGPGLRPRNNVELSRHGRDRTNVWHCPSIHTLREGEEGDLLTLHPTCKPVKMVAHALPDCSKRSDMVLDASWAAARR